VSVWAAKRNEPTLAEIHAQLDGAAVAEAWERGLALTVDEAVSLAVEAADKPAGGITTNRAP
jgi:hypothetical protein